MGLFDAIKGAFEKVGEGVKTLVTGGYNKEIEQGIKDVANKVTECKTTNQGGTMDEIRQEMKNINNESRGLLKQVRDVTQIYSLNAELGRVKAQLAASENANDIKERRYIAEQTSLKGEVDQLYRDIGDKVNELDRINNDITTLNDNILNHEHNIESDYEIINTEITENDKKIIDSNKARTDINRASFSIAYLEKLLLSSYNLIYRAIHYENSSIDNGKNDRENNNANNLSNDVYQTDRVNFYKNINTFLFYFYYLMIIALVIVVLKFNESSLLIKLTFFRVFAILLILYPIFIIPFQDFVYWFVKSLLSKI